MLEWLGNDAAPLGAKSNDGRREDESWPTSKDSHATVSQVVLDPLGGTDFTPSGSLSNQPGGFVRRRAVKMKDSSGWPGERVLLVLNE